MRTAKVLADREVEALARDLVTKYQVGAPERRETVGSDLAHDPHRESGSGEGLAPDDGFGQSQLDSDLSDLILEKALERLNDLKTQLVGNAGVVVGLDFCRSKTGGPTFDDVRVQRPLDKELHVLELLCFVDKHVEKLVPDYLPFELRVGYSGKAPQEAGTGVDGDNT